MSITLGIPSDASESDIVLKNCITIVEVVPRVPGPMDILLRPPDKVMDLITVVHSIHC